MIGHMIKYGTCTCMFKHFVPVVHFGIIMIHMTNHLNLKTYVSKSEHEMSCVGNIGSIYQTFFCVVCELKGSACYWMIGGVVSRPCAMY